MKRFFIHSDPKCYVVDIRLAEWANTKQEQQIQCGTGLDLVVGQCSVRKIILKFFFKKTVLEL